MKIKKKLQIRVFGYEFRVESTEVQDQTEEAVVEKEERAENDNLEGNDIEDKSQGIYSVITLNNIIYFPPYF